MGLVIPFSEFKSYYSAIRPNGEFAKGTIFDTNILISLTLAAEAISRSQLDEIGTSSQVPQGREPLDR